MLKLLRLGQGCSEQPRTQDVVREGQSGNRSPNIGSPLTDGPCSPRPEARPSARRACRLRCRRRPRRAGRPLPEKGPCASPERRKMRFLHREIAAMHESGWHEPDHQPDRVDGGRGCDRLDRAHVCCLVAVGDKPGADSPIRWRLSQGGHRRGNERYCTSRKLTQRPRRLDHHPDQSTLRGRPGYANLPIAVRSPSSGSKKKNSLGLRRHSLRNRDGADCGLARKARP
jgi:hypothetical protein